MPKPQGGAGGAHQQCRGVYVDGFNHCELLLCFLHCCPRSVQLGLHPVAHTAVLPLEGGGQGPGQEQQTILEEFCSKNLTRKMPSPPKHANLLRELEGEGELVPSCLQDSGLSIVCGQNRLRRISSLLQKCLPRQVPEVCSTQQGAARGHSRVSARAELQQL